MVSSRPSIRFMFWTAAPPLPCRPVVPKGDEGGGISIALQGASGAGYPLYSNPVVSSRPSKMFMFWTAAPDAPLPRLSNNAVTVKAWSLPATTI